MRLPDFRLETHFARWEFTAEHHLTASDAEAMSMRELLAFGTAAQRDAFENCCAEFLAGFLVWLFV